MLTLNLQYITDPLPYLRKQKLRALALPSDYTTDVQLITPLGTTHEFTKVTSNLELVELIQELIDVSYDAMAIWCEQRSMYIKH
jgi:hypothetical protein